jgi:hypothetical protein
MPAFSIVSDARNFEPQLPRRKKITDPKPSSYGAYFTEPIESRDRGDEYVLLGDQSKFAPNIVYRVRSRSALVGH